MRRPSFIVTVGMAAALLGGAWLISPGISPFQAQAHAGRGGGVAGTYLGEFLVGPATLLGLATLHNDGTWSMSDQTDFGGIPGLESTQSPWRGSWAFTGPRQTTHVGLCFSFGPDGVPTRLSRIEVVMDWERGFDSGMGVASQRFYAPGEDPLDPDAGTLAPPPLDALPVAVRRVD